MYCICGTVYPDEFSKCPRCGKPNDKSKPDKRYNHTSTSDEFSKCPDCQAKLMFTEGCMKCPACGWSACG